MYVEAYRCYEHVFSRLKQIKSEQVPIAYSGMAYGLTLLAHSIEQKQIDHCQTKVPNVTELRHQAHDLLKQAIDIDPVYLNARLFLARLLYDQKDYKRALEEVTNALSIQPLHSTALMRKGFIVDELGDSEMALELLSLAKHQLEVAHKNKENERWIKEIEEKTKEIKGRS